MKPFDEHGVFRPTAGSDGLRRLAIRGAGVTVLSQGVGFAIQLLATVVLARLLAPADFGILTMVSTFSLLLMNVGLNGFTEATLQREEIDHGLASNLFWINAGLGLLLTIGFAASGSLLARFFGDPRLVRVTAAMSATILLTSLSVQHLALLKRAMRFSVLSTNDIVARALSVAVSILFGWAAWGYWALVAGAVALPLATMLGAWSACRWIPGPPRRHPGTGPMVRFATNTYGRFMTDYCTRNLDNLLVGWQFGPQALGFYKKAYDLFVLPLNQLSAPLTNVAVSTMSRMQHDPDRRARHFLGALSTLAFVGMGLGAGLTLAGRDLIFVLLGPGWEESGRIFTIFGPGIGILLLYGTHGWIHLSIGRADRWLRWSIVEFATTTVLFVIGLRWGPAGIAAAWIASFGILAIPAFWYAGRPALIPVGRVIDAVWRYVTASALAGCATFVLVRSLPSVVAEPGVAGALERIAIVSSVFGILYIGAVILLHRGCAPFSQLAALLREMIPWRRLSRASAALVLVISVTSVGQAATRPVQLVGKSEYSEASTAAATFSAYVTAGNLVAVYVAWTNAVDTLVSVTDNLGNQYQLVQNPTTLGSVGRAAGAYAKNIAGGPCTVTVTFSPGTLSARTIIVTEINGADPVSPLDGSTARAQFDPGNGAGAVTSGSMTTTADGDYIFAAASDQGFASILYPGTGFAGRDSFQFPVGARSEDAVQASAGAIEARFTNAGATFADFITLAMAFKPPASPDTTPPSVVITAPTSAGAVSGTIPLSATASDDVALAGVQFQVDGVNLGDESIWPPYSTSWNSATGANVAHTLTAVARDAAGNTTSSPPVVVAVNNIGPSQGVIGAGRRIEWSQAGVSGGIPNRTTSCATLNPGATSSAINDAIAACSNGVVHLSAGTYNLTGGITFGGRSQVTLRGAGPDQTVLAFSGGDPCGGISADVCIHGASNVWSGNVPAANIRSWTAGYDKDGTRITLDSTAGLVPGTILVLDQLDDGTDTGGAIVSDAPGFSIEGGAPGRANRSQQQFVQVIAISGNQVAISPGLHMPNWRASQAPQAWWWGETARMDGVEDLTLDHTSSPGTAGVEFGNAFGGWIKNVKSLNASRNHVFLYQSARIEIRNSYFYGTKNAASQSYGVESFTTSDDLVVNNIFQHITAPIMMGSNAGSVVAYNFMTDMYYMIPTWMMAGIQGSHDAGTGMNLFESNVGNSFLMDLYHGTGGLVTLFRNQFTGTEPGKPQGNTIAVNIWGYNRLVNIIGNVLGTPDYHAVYEDSSAGTQGFPDRSVYGLGYTGVGESILTGLAYDPLVRTTLLRWGNFDYATSQTHWDAAEIPAGNAVPPDHALPPSLFLFAKPSWWGSMPWPAIGPDVAGGQDAAGHVFKIPAQVCYENSPKDSFGILLFNAGSCYPQQ